MKTLRPTYINKVGITTNLNNSFYIGNEKRLLRWDSCTCKFVRDVEN